MRPNQEPTIGHGRALRRLAALLASAALLVPGPALMLAPAVRAVEAYVVISTADSGEGTLRQAILDANGNSGVLDNITFNIPKTDPGYDSTGDVWTISPASALPGVTEAVVIDGYTQPGASQASGSNSATLKIALNGADAGDEAGLWLDTGSDGSTVRGLAIGAFEWSGIVVDSDANVISGNYIGTDAAGTVAVPNGYGSGVDVYGDNNTVGGTTAASRNVISGNTTYGVDIAGSSTSVQGNYIGTNAAGSAALGNGVYGVNLGGTNSTIGGTTAGARNVISGNLSDGVYVGLDDAGSVQGNYIGPMADGSLTSGNAGYGIRVSASGIVIGGTAAGAGNVIAGNRGAGVFVFCNWQGCGVDNAILGNSIHDNFGLGINLLVDGDVVDVTPNDPGDTDSGPNNLQNFPVLTSAAAGDSSTTVAGSLNSTPGTAFRLEFFDSPACDASGYGEGQTYLGSTSVTTDASSGAAFSTTLGTAATVGHVVTATATDPAGNTSEFSACQEVTSDSGAPTDIALSNSSIPENWPAGTVVGTFSTTDSDLGDTFTYSLVAGSGDTDNASFEIVSDEQTLLTKEVFDFETQGSYSIRVRSVDADGLSFEKAFTITVGDMTEAACTNGGTAIATMADLQGVDSSVATRAATYCLANDLDATGFAFTPIGDWFNPFRGAFDGQDHTISNLTTYRSAYAGLFGRILGGSVANVRLANVNVSGDNAVGGLAGRNEGTITNSHSSGTVSAADSSGDYVGGLVGQNLGAIYSSSTAGTVTGGHEDTGGLVGYSTGGEFSSHSSANVTGVEYATGGLVGYQYTNNIVDCYATGNVAATTASDGTPGTGYTNAGGLVGSLFGSGTVTRSYSTGSVVNTGNYAYTGGLVGNNQDGIVTDSYSTGNVTATGRIYTLTGGLVGYNFNTVVASYSTGSVSASGSGPLTSTGGLVGYYDAPGTVTSGYWDTTTSGRAWSAGGAGLTDSAMRRQTSFAGFDFTTVWGIAEGVTYPYLQWQAPVITGATPAADATGIAAGTTVTVTFNAAMDAATFADDTFYLTAAGSPAHVGATLGWPTPPTPRRCWAGAPGSRTRRATPCRPAAGGASRSPAGRPPRRPSRSPGRPAPHTVTPTRRSRRTAARAPGPSPSTRARRRSARSSRASFTWTPAPAPVRSRPPRPPTRTTTRPPTTRSWPSARPTRPSR
jgi:hypothetical protein